MEKSLTSIFIYGVPYAVNHARLLFEQWAVNEDLVIKTGPHFATLGPDKAGLLLTTFADAATCQAVLKQVRDNGFDTTVTLSGHKAHDIDSGIAVPDEGTVWEVHANPSPV